MWFSLSFANWFNCAKGILVYERLYYKSKWTPVVRVKLRYLKTKMDDSMANLYEKNWKSPTNMVFQRQPDNWSGL